VVICLIPLPDYLARFANSQNFNFGRVKQVWEFPRIWESHGTHAEQRRQPKARNLNKRTSMLFLGREEALHDPLHFTSTIELNIHCRPSLAEILCVQQWLYEALLRSFDSKGRQCSLEFTLTPCSPCHFSLLHFVARARLVA
jgi:hypothetical protein